MSDTNYLTVGTDILFVDKLFYSVALVHADTWKTDYLSYEFTILSVFSLHRILACAQQKYISFVQLFLYNSHPLNPCPAVSCLWLCVEGLIWSVLPGQVRAEKAAPSNFN